MQETGVVGRPPVVALAAFDKCVQIVERLHVQRLKAGDFREALDLFSSESNAIAEAKHRALVVKVSSARFSRGLYQPVSNRALLLSGFLAAVAPISL